jgi:hypothetical protein
LDKRMDMLLKTALCFLDVEYTITICDVGAGTEKIASVTLNITLLEDGSLLVLENFGSPPVGLLLSGPENAPNNCIEVPYASVIDVCTETEYMVTVDVAAVAPNRGIPCTGTDTIEFVSETSPPAPKLSPSRDVSSSQPTPVRGCTPTDPGCTPIPCTSDCECEALYRGETFGVCLCEPEDPDDCEFDHDGGDVDDGNDDGVVLAMMMMAVVARSLGVVTLMMARDVLPSYWQEGWWG